MTGEITECQGMTLLALERRIALESKAFVRSNHDTFSSVIPKLVEKLSRNYNYDMTTSPTTISESKRRQEMNKLKQSLSMMESLPSLESVVGLHQKNTKNDIVTREDSMAKLWMDAINSISDTTDTELSQHVLDPYERRESRLGMKVPMEFGRLVDLRSLDKVSSKDEASLIWYMYSRSDPSQEAIALYDDPTFKIMYDRYKGISRNCQNYSKEEEQRHSRLHNNIVTAITMCGLNVEFEHSATVTEKGRPREIDEAATAIQCFFRGSRYRKVAAKVVSKKKISDALNTLLAELGSSVSLKNSAKESYVSSCTRKQYVTRVPLVR